MPMPWRSRAVCLCLVAALVLAAACKNDGGRRPSADAPADGGTVIDARHRETPELYAADAAYLQKNSTFFFRVFDQAFSRRLADLPAAGEVPDGKKPYSGGYYAEGDGGTHQIVAGNQTPLEKYDDAFHGGESRASAWEQEKHTTGPSWAGHCNGFAAAAQRHPQEPETSVTRGSVTFAPQDIKALLAEIHMSADYEFLGGNRCDVPGGTPTPDGRADPAVMGVCEDINPGTLHAAVANWLGRMRHTLVMDMFAGDEVWNYPLYKYQVLQNDEVSPAQAVQYVTGGGGEYVFNPTAVKFAYVRIRLTYAEASRRELLDQLIPKDMDLTYILELDQDGAIVGGEWVGPESRSYHPDFLWVALEPLEPNGTRYMGNPHVSNQEVIKLWAESVGADPDQPPLDIKRPSGPDDWGRWATFEVVLDGNARGAVFGGKPAELRIKRKAALAAEDVDLEVLLNGAPLKTLTATGEDDIAFAFAPSTGLSRLQLTWRRGGAVVEDQYLRFHAVR